LGYQFGVIFGNKGIDFLVYFTIFVYKPVNMKNGKIKTNSFRNYNVVFGSNNNNSKAVYINISAWAEPQT
jgi:hypothetical protein